MRELCRATRQAADSGFRNASGDYSVDKTLARFPAWDSGPRRRVKRRSVTISDIFSAWEAGPKQEVQPATVKRYRSIFGFLSSYFGDRDVNSLSDDDVHEWATHRRDKQGVTARSINRNDLSAVKAVFGWATTRYARRLLQQNPASNVRLTEQKFDIMQQTHLKSLRAMRCDWLIESDLMEQMPQEATARSSAVTPANDSRWA
nr:site-specific integrase [Methylobacterium sp. SD274]